MSYVPLCLTSYCCMCAPSATRYPAVSKFLLGKKAGISQTTSYTSLPKTRTMAMPGTDDEELHPFSACFNDATDSGVVHSAMNTTGDLTDSHPLLHGQG